MTGKFWSIVILPLLAAWPLLANNDPSGNPGGDHIIPVSTGPCGQVVTFTYRGKTVTYGTVEGQNGTCWMDRNLGASRPATSFDDSQAFGDLFQWGRPGDGHQDRKSEITLNLSPTDRPGHEYFISVDAMPYDWLMRPNDMLWRGPEAPNNVCPAGWRLPTRQEWRNEMASWKDANRQGAVDSPLKLPSGGMRTHDNQMKDAGRRGYYWSSDFSRDFVYVMSFARRELYMLTSDRASGRSVRCIREQKP
jgi:uncharacterized protein (TIGR02145 family)